MYLRSLTAVVIAASVVVVLSAFALAGWGGGRARAEEPKVKKPATSPALDHLRPGSPTVDHAKPCPAGPGLGERSSEAQKLRSSVEEKKKPAAVKRWYQLSGRPGWYGYGALNSAGQVVVEQRRYCANGACRFR